MLDMTLKRAESARPAETDERLMPRLDRLPQPLTAWLRATAEAVGSLKNLTVLIHPSEHERAASNSLYKANVNATFYLSQPARPD